jgi:methylated-DNA-[protein]-cysteine S-methyltransferase
MGNIPSDMTTMKTCYQEFPSPIGPIYIVADSRSLRAITFGGNWKSLKKALGNISRESNDIIRQTHIQLQEYFAKKRTTFDLPIRFNGTEFQQQTWKALLTIPYGETRSYSEQAHIIGNPKAVRAVGRTNGLNPIPIIVPCHRVIGKSGELTGFAGGLDIKKFLLILEGNEVTHMSLAKAEP